MIRTFNASALTLIFALVLAGCGGSSGPTPSGPTVTTTTTAAPVSQFQITTLITVYRNAGSFAEFTEGTTTNEDIGKILLVVDSLQTGTTLLDNELLRFDLQQAIDRVNEQFADADYEAAFGETKENLRRFFNDADNDGWSVDGRHGVGRDWPHDGDGNDPDGWTSQMVIRITRT